MTDFFGFFFPCFVGGTISQVVLCCFVSGERCHGCSEGGVLSPFNDGGFPISTGDDSMRYFFRSLAIWPAAADPLSSPLFHKLAADG